MTKITKIYQQKPSNKRKKLRKKSKNKVRWKISNILVEPLNIAEEKQACCDPCNQNQNKTLDINIARSDLASLQKIQINILDENDQTKKNSRTKSKVSKTPSSKNGHTQKSPSTNNNDDNKNNNNKPTILNRIKKVAQAAVNKTFELDKDGSILKKLEAFDKEKIAPVAEFPIVHGLW